MIRILLKYCFILTISVVYLENIWLFVFISLSVAFLFHLFLYCIVKVCNVHLISNTVAAASDQKMFSDQLAVATIQERLPIKI